MDNQAFPMQHRISDTPYKRIETNEFEIDFEIDQSSRPSGFSLIVPRKIKVNDKYNIMTDDLDNIDRTVAFYLTIFVTIFSYIFSLIPPFGLFFIRIFQEYERGVVFRFGKLRKVAGPGIFYIHPFLDTYRNIDVRIKNINVGAQEILTKDSVTIRVDAIVFFHVFNATKAVLEINCYKTATTLLAATTLRSVVGQSELDELLGMRERINQKMNSILTPRCSEWGVRIDSVEIRDVILPIGMQRVMACQAEAERERRSKIISAEGEAQSASILCNAATIMSENPATFQLRYFQTLNKLSDEYPSKIIFPIPLSLDCFPNSAYNAS